MGRAYSCWMLNCWCISWPVGFKRLTKHLCDSESSVNYRHIQTFLKFRFVSAKLIVWSYPEAVKSRPYGLTHTDYVILLLCWQLCLGQAGFLPHWRLFGRHLCAFLLSPLCCITYYRWEVLSLLNYWPCHREAPNFDFGRCGVCPTGRLSWFYSVLLTTARIVP